MVRRKVFWGISLLAYGVALGGNDNPLWLEHRPMSNTTQTFLMMGFVTIGAWLLSSIIPKEAKWR